LTAWLQPWNNGWCCWRSSASSVVVGARRGRETRSVDSSIGRGRWCKTPAKDLVLLRKSMESVPKVISYDSTDLRSDGATGSGTAMGMGLANGVETEGGVGDGVGDGAVSRPKVGLTMVTVMTWRRGRRRRHRGRRRQGRRRRRGRGKLGSLTPQNQISSRLGFHVGAKLPLYPIRYWYRLT
jgi:hypothetical protein